MCLRETLLLHRICALPCSHPLLGSAGMPLLLPWLGLPCVRPPSPHLGTFRPLLLGAGENSSWFVLAPSESIALPDSLLFLSRLHNPCVGVMSLVLYSLGATLQNVASNHDACFAGRQATMVLRYSMHVTLAWYAMLLVALLSRNAHAARDLNQLPAPSVFAPPSIFAAPSVLPAPSIIPPPGIFPPPGTFVTSPAANTIKPSFTALKNEEETDEDVEADSTEGLGTSLSDAIEDAVKDQVKDTKAEINEEVKDAQESVEDEAEVAMEDAGSGVGTVGTVRSPWAPDMVLVETAEELLTALEEGYPHVEIRQHMDLTPFELYGRFTSALPESVKTVRVGIPPFFSACVVPKSRSAIASVLV